MPEQTVDPNEKPREPAPWIGMTVLGVLALGIALYNFPAPESGVTQPIYGVAHPTAGSTLLATLSTNAVHDWDDKERLTLEVSGESRAQLNNLTVCVDGPGFRAENDHCVKVGSEERTIELVPAASSGIYQLLVTATWTRMAPKQQPQSAGNPTQPVSSIDCALKPEACRPVTEKSVLPLGPVRIEIDHWGRLVTRSVEFIKDMALPIILLVLGVLLNNVTAKRDQLRKDREREQDEDQQIVRILLPKVMDLAGKYYLPMTWNAERFVIVSKKGMDKTEELVFHLLNFFVIARGLKDTAGGIFFKDLDAEKIFANGNRILRAVTLQACGSEQDFNRTLNRLSMLAPKDRWPRLTDVQSFKGDDWIKLETWLKKLPEDKRFAVRYLFNVLRGVLSYESNAPYFNWYRGTGAAITFSLVEEMKTEPKSDVFKEEDPEGEQELQSSFEKFKTLLKGYRARKQKDAQRQAKKDSQEDEAES